MLDKHPHPAPRRFEVLVLSASILPLALLPWTMSWWPTEDNANHLAVAHILSHYGDAGTPWKTYFTEPNLTPQPYMLHYYLLLLLGRIWTLPAADKILTSLLTVACPLSAKYFIEQFVPSRRQNIFLLMPLVASSYALNRGLVGFVIGVVFAILTVAAYKRGQRGRFAPTRIISVSALAFAAMLAHPSAAALALLAIVAIERKGLFRAPAALRIASVVAPMAILLVLHHLRVNTPSLSGSPVFDGPWYRFKFSEIETESPIVAGLRCLTSISMWEVPIRGLSMCLLLWAVVRGCARSPDTVIYMLFLVLGVFLLIPSQMAGGAYLQERVLLFLLVVMACAGEPPGVLNRPKVLPLLGLTSCLLLAIVQFGTAKRESETLEEIIRAGDVLPSGARLAYAPGDMHGYGTNYLPEQFAWGYVLMRRSIVVPDVFADREVFGDGLSSDWGGVGYRPLVYTPTSDLQPLLLELGAVPLDDAFDARLSTYDYLMVVNGSPELLLHLRDRVPIRSSKHVQVFKLKG